MWWNHARNTCGARYEIFYHNTIKSHRKINFFFMYLYGWPIENRPLSFLSFYSFFPFPYSPYYSIFPVFMLLAIPLLHTPFPCFVPSLTHPPHLCFIRPLAWRVIRKGLHILLSLICLWVINLTLICFSPCSHRKIISLVRMTQIPQQTVLTVTLS